MSRRFLRPPLGALLSLPLLSPILAGPPQDPAPLPPIPEGMVLVHGTVRSHLDGSALPGVHVTLRDPTAGCDSPATQTTTSDVEGKFRFLPFEPGHRTIVTSTPADPATRKPPFPPTETHLRPEGPGPIEVDLVLGELGSVAGQVIDDETGSPLPGARVTIRTSDIPAVVANSRGEFRLDGLALRNRSQRLAVEVPTYAPFWAELVLGEESVEGLKIRMRRARTLYGTVRRESGEEVGQIPGADGEAVPIVVDVQGWARVPFLHPDGRLELLENSPGRIDVKGAKTDPNGNWRIDEMDPDFQWSVALRGSPYRKDDVPTFSFGPTERTKRVSLTLVTSTRIEGRVLDEEGNPIREGGGILAAAVAIANEVFETPLVVIERTEEGSVARWASDAPDRIASYPERISSSVRMRETHLARIGSEGRFELPSVELGPTIFFVRRAEHAPRAFLLDVTAEMPPWDATLFPNRETTVEGRVLGADGEGRAGVPVRAWSIAADAGEVAWLLARGSTGERGEFVLRFEHGGPWRIQAGDGSATVESETMREPTAALTLRLE